MQKTKISEVEALVSTAPKQRRADEVRAKGSMGDVEAAYAKPPADLVAARLKAAKSRIDCAVHGVEDTTPAEVAKVPPAALSKPGAKK